MSDDSNAPCTCHSAIVGRLPVAAQISIECRSLIAKICKLAILPFELKRCIRRCTRRCTRQLERFNFALFFFDFLAACSYKAVLIWFHRNISKSVWIWKRMLQNDHKTVSAHAFLLESDTLILGIKRRMSFSNGMLGLRICLTTH